MRLLLLFVFVLVACGKAKGEPSSESAPAAELADGHANCGKPFESSFPIPAIAERAAYYDSRAYNQALGLKFPDSYEIELNPAHAPDAIVTPMLSISDRSISDRTIPVGRIQPIQINMRDGPSVDMFGAGLPKNVAVVDGTVVVCKLPKHKGDNIVVYVDVQVGNYIDNTPFGTVHGTLDLPVQYRDASDVH